MFTRMGNPKPEFPTLIYKAVETCSTTHQPDGYFIRSMFRKIIHYGDYWIYKVFNKCSTTQQPDMRILYVQENTELGTFSC